MVFGAAHSLGLGIALRLHAGTSRPVTVAAAHAARIATTALVLYLAARRGVAVSSALLVGFVLTRSAIVAWVVRHD
jgi:hypothetical protein